MEKLSIKVAVNIEKRSEGQAWYCRVCGNPVVGQIARIAWLRNNGFCLAHSIDDILGSQVPVSNVFR